VPDVTTVPRVTIRDVDPGDDAALRAVAALHEELLAFGPLAALGADFLRTVCYRAPVRGGLMSVALAEVDGVPAGFVAWTAESGRFHAEAMRSNLGVAAVQGALALLRDPRRLRAAPRILRVMRSRVDDGGDRDSVGEVIGLVARPEFVTPAFRRQTRTWISRDLVAHAAAALHGRGRTRLRMFVAAENTKALVLYQVLGADFAPVEHGGEPTVAVTFALPFPAGGSGR
jgi:hypothetical protein